MNQMILNQMIQLLFVCLFLAGCRTPAPNQELQVSLNQITRIGDAIVRYRADNDQNYPESLGLLVPAYLSDEDELWIQNKDSLPLHAEYLVYDPDGFQFGSSRVVAFTSSVLPGGKRVVINDDETNSVWIWGEGAFQAWLSGDQSF